MLLGVRGGFGLWVELRLYRNAEIQNCRNTEPSVSELDEVKCSRSEIQNGAVAGAAAAWIGGVIELIVRGGNGAESTDFRNRGF